MNAAPRTSWQERIMAPARFASQGDLPRHPPPSAAGPGGLTSDRCQRCPAPIRARSILRASDRPMPNPPWLRRAKRAEDLRGGATLGPVSLISKASVAPCRLHIIHPLASARPTTASAALASSARSCLVELIAVERPIGHRSSGSHRRRRSHSSSG
jgi:hypothetical protein